MLKSLVAALLVLTVHSAHADLQKENLLIEIPKDYKLGFETKRENMIIAEYVPIDQDVSNWSDVLTAQIFLGLKPPSVKAFQAVGQGMLVKSCQDAKFMDIWQGQENGYAALVWIQLCPHNEKTKRMELTYLKAIQGNDSLYLVQKAFKVDPPKEDQLKWVNFLKTVLVCDTRASEHPCPKM